MSIQNQLSHSLGVKTQEGNKALAVKIADLEDYDQLNELCQFIEMKPLERLQMDAMLTLAHIAEQNPKMMTGRIDFLLNKLNDPINRVVFGSMIALAHVAHLVLDKLYQELSLVLDAMESGTVVTRDHGFRILVILYREEKYCEDTFCIILEQLTLAPANQLGQYTERMTSVIRQNHKNRFIAILEDRRGELTVGHHIKRLEKNLKKLYK